MLVLCPLLVVESFNRERTSGEYRIVMIRPYSRTQFYSAKIISLAIIMGILMFILWILAMILGGVLLPQTPATSFFNPEVRIRCLRLSFFNFKFLFSRIFYVACNN